MSERVEGYASLTSFLNRTLEPVNKRVGEASFEARAISIGTSGSTVTTIALAFSAGSVKDWDSAKTEAYS